LRKRTAKREQIGTEGFLGPQVCTFDPKQIHDDSWDVLALPDFGRERHGRNSGRLTQPGPLAAIACAPLHCRALPCIYRSQRHGARR
jgi:hypothetical protein